MEKINMVLKRTEKVCEIFVGLGLFDFLAEDLKKRPLGRRLGIITDTRVETVLGNRLHKRLIRAGIKTDVIAIDPGEDSKQWKTVQWIFERLIALGFDRKSALIALGGGVLGDVTGFVASLYMRSIPYAQVPTTLLAQVDSCLGGKTGIDLPQGKNLLGTFYQPSRVYVDTSILGTLPYEEIQNGLAEVIKTAVVRDRGLFQLLENRHDAIVDEKRDALEEVVARCCRIKSDVVMADERDTGLRRILNFGHTVGHAIEAYTNYRVPHGMAVSMGMAAEAVLSTRMKMLQPEEKQRVLQLLKRYDLPALIPASYDTEKLIGIMHSDKKAEDGRIAVVLPKTIGDAMIMQSVPTLLIEEVIKEVQG
ncbi:MAG: 3-dehydroquinate synthase [Syntrophobacterales bacterium]|nr:MAG: 3-dehydroquinate synthase [Syntrophobacterales bacterium]